MLTKGARRAAVLGRPIAHSLSPVLHTAAYAALGLPWRYESIEVDSAGLPGILDSLDEAWVGLSLTMPLKEAVLPLLDEVSDLARAVRAANTVLLREGRRLGENTDVFGMVSAVGQVAAGPMPRAAIIGAGATARTAVAAAAELGARSLTVVGRRPEAAAEVLELAQRLGIAADAAPWSPDAIRASGALHCDLVVSSVPGDAAAPFAEFVPARPGVLLDVTYAPWPTSLAAAWTSRRGAVAAGAEMLLWQAARQVELMTGRTAPVAAMRAALG